MATKAWVRKDGTGNGAMGRINVVSGMQSMEPAGMITAVKKGCIKVGTRGFMPSNYVFISSGEASAYGWQQNPANQDLAISGAQQFGNVDFSYEP